MPDANVKKAILDIINSPWPEERSPLLDSVFKNICLDGESAVYAGHMFFKNSLFEAAAICFQSAISHYPESAPVIANAAVCLEAIGEPASALVLAQRCLKIEPDNPQWRNNVERLLRFQSQISEARKGLVVMNYNEFLSDNTTYAQEGMDIKLKKYMRKPFGIFFEAGANDGVSMSNTKIFEDKFGWRGVLVEPSYRGWRLCKLSRPGSISVRRALVGRDFKEKQVLGDFDGNLMGSIGGSRLQKKARHSVSATTISQLIHEYGIDRIDFMSLDLEGYEFEALCGIDFVKHRPNYLLIEIYLAQKDPIFSLLYENGYKMIKNMTNFARETHPNWDGSHNDYLFGDARSPDVILEEDA